MVAVLRQPNNWGFRPEPPKKFVANATITARPDRNTGHVELSYASGGPQKSTAWYVRLTPYRLR